MSSKCLGKIVGIHEDFVEFDYQNGTDDQEARDFCETHAEEPLQPVYRVLLVNGHGYRFVFDIWPERRTEWDGDDLATIEPRVLNERKSRGPGYVWYRDPKAVEELREEAALEWPEMPPPARPSWSPWNDSATAPVKVEGTKVTCGEQSVDVCFSGIALYYATEWGESPSEISFDAAEDLIEALKVAVREGRQRQAAYEKQQDEETARFYADNPHYCPLHFGEEAVAEWRKKHGLPSYCRSYSIHCSENAEDRRARCHCKEESGYEH